jgi:hypothetical protein
MTHAASNTIPVPEHIRRRLQEKLTDPARKARYEKWCHDPETIETVSIFKEIFCRPVDGPVSAENAVWHLGYNSGAWDICDSMIGAQAVRAPDPEPELDYSEGGESDKKKGTNT